MISRKNKKKKSLGYIIVRMTLSTLTKEEYNEVFVSLSSIFVCVPETGILAGGLGVYDVFSCKNCLFPH